MKKFIFILLLIMSMGAMYYFSSQDGDTSSGQSQMAIDVVQDVRDKVTLKDENLIKVKDKVLNYLKQYNKSTLVRKGAHFSIYALIGGFMMIVIYLFSNQVIFSACISFALTFMYAVFDERRQLSVPGRGGSLRDVFIDSSGAMLSIIILSVIFLVFKGLKFIFKRKREEDINDFVKEED